MIYCLTGELIGLDGTSYSAVIDCAGVGYRVSVSANTLTKLAAKQGETVRVFTHLQVREDGIDLFGFHDTDEAEAFRILITVSGVGPKAALAILSVMDPMELSAAVATGDSKALSRAQGVGAKTAARIVLELKDKLQKAFPVFGADTSDSDTQAATAKAPRASSSVSDAADALVVLGYSRSEAVSALRGVDTSLSVEDMIRKALSNLMKQ